MKIKRVELSTTKYINLRAYATRRLKHLAIDQITNETAC